MDLLISVSGLAVPAFLICRYRAVGLLIAIPLGWGILALLTLTSGHGSWQDRDFIQEWPSESGLVSILWCLLISVGATLTRWIIEQRRCRAV